MNRHGIASEFLSRTKRGTEALLASVTAARCEPERAGYLAAGVAAGIARGMGRSCASTPLRLILPPLLSGTVLRSTRAPRDKVVLLAGLGAGWVGETEKCRTQFQPSALGIAAVAGQHLAYVMSLMRRGTRLSRVSAGSRLVVWVSGVGVAAYRRKGGVPLVPAAATAGLLAATTSALAEDRALQNGSVPRQGVDHGANLVLASEGLTLVRAVVGPRQGVAGQALDAGITVSAVIGHLLLVDALMRG